MEKVIIERMNPDDYSFAESMRSLRTNLSFCGDDIKCILLTSTAPDEGKSTISLNLACSLAKDKKRVLLVDADLRKSVLVGRQGVRLEKGGILYGLSHYLSGQKKLDDIIYQTNQEGMDLIVAGPSMPNPTEMLGNHYFVELIEKARQIYDVIIVDGTPIGSVIDSVVVARECDGAILVVEQGNVSRKFIQRIKKQLENSGVRILGAVLNKVKISSKGYYYNEYYKPYYGEYGHNSKK